MNHREIPTHIGEEYSHHQEMRFLETSAKEADNVERLFMEIASELTQQAKQSDLRPSLSSSSEIASGGSTPISSLSCCKSL